VNEHMAIWIAALLSLDLLVTASRAGLLNLQHARLVSLREKHGASVDKTISLVSHRARTRSTFKLVQSILRFSIGGLSLALFTQDGIIELQLIQIILLLIVVAALIWLVEFLVERLVLRSPEDWAIRLTPLARVLTLLFYPLLALPLNLTGSNESAGNLVNISEDELISLVDASQQAGEIEKDELEMIHSVYRFDETVAREIMVPRVDTTVMDVKSPLEEAADTALQSGYSRIPVYQGQSDNIIGILYTKDLLKAWRSGGAITSLQELLRPAYFIPEAKKVSELLDEMQANRIHIAIVVDEYGGVAGLVTLEDIVEEIFGEIEDEYDDEEDLYEQVGEDEFLFPGRISLDDVNELMGVTLEAEDTDTLGGLIYSRIGRVPRKGEKLVEDDVELTVEQINERRINKVRAKKMSPEPE
jgi:putative hemolysin